jgi:hypothetical protein
MSFSQTRIEEGCQEGATLQKPSQQKNNITRKGKIAKTKVAVVTG